MEIDLIDTLIHYTYVTELKGLHLTSIHLLRNTEVFVQESFFIMGSC